MRVWHWSCHNLARFRTRLYTWETRKSQPEGLALSGGKRQRQLILCFSEVPHARYCAHQRTASVGGRARVQPTVSTNRGPLDAPMYHSMIPKSALQNAGWIRSRISTIARSPRRASAPPAKNARSWTAFTPMACACLGVCAFYACSQSKCLSILPGTM